MRICGLALALAASRDGFLLIDEMENGIHHSVQAEVWRFLLRTAKENNVQVVATTHGLDCVRKFADAAFEEKNIEGLLVRIESAKGKSGNLRAVEYSEEVLQSATEQGFEVR